MITGKLRSLARRFPGARRAYTAARFGDVRRTAPLSNWGVERGKPVDRWYIESFLSTHSVRVSGRVLEVKSDQYSSWLGASAVEVVDIDPSNPRATVVGDLCHPSTLEAGRYDAAVVTQTLQLVADPKAALQNILRSLRPGGALLVTVPCLSRLVGETDRWRWTPYGFGQLAAEAAPPSAHIEVQGMGNGLSARAFLFGMAAEDLDQTALSIHDPNYPLVVGTCVRLQ